MMKTESLTARGYLPPEADVFSVRLNGSLLIASEYEENYDGVGMENMGDEEPFNW